MLNSYLRRSQRATRPPVRVRCAHCGRMYDESAHDTLTRTMMAHEPACSVKCNRALGQAHTPTI